VRDVTEEQTTQMIDSKQGSVWVTSEQLKFFLPSEHEKLNVPLQSLFRQATLPN
jgi:hypothetical protein